MKKIDNREEQLILYCDDSNTASPEELAAFPWTEEDERKLTKAYERGNEKFFSNNDTQQEITATPFDVAKYILTRTGAKTNLALQKLFYYAQARHYTWTKERLTDAEFQAWRHGPVCPALYDVLKQYGNQPITADDIVGNIDILTPDQKDSIDIMLEHYGDFSASKLLKTTHSEDPWKKARGDLPENANSDAIITLESMEQYYREHPI